MIFHFYISCRHLHFLGIHELLLEDWVVIVAHNREVVTASHADILDITDFSSIFVD